MNPMQPILERLRQLVLERQRLEDRGAPRVELEANRSEIVEEAAGGTMEAVDNYEVLFYDA
jgi:hypothetical protein